MQSNKHYNKDKNIILLADTLDVTKMQCTYTTAIVDKKTIQAIVNSGAPKNIISSCFIKRMSFKPDVNCDNSFGTTGPKTTKALGAYSSMPI